jgi:hypothetical protein
MKWITSPCTNLLTLLAAVVLKSRWAVDRWRFRTMISCSSSVGNIEAGVDKRDVSSRHKCHALFGSWRIGGVVPSGGHY